MSGFKVFLDFLKMMVMVTYHYLLALYRLCVPNKPKVIQGQVVLITGAGRGIGRELAVQFASKGARLALWDIDKNSVDETAVLVKEHGGIAYSYACDVTNKAAVGDVAKQVRKDLGDVDILVNNAGIMSCKDILSLTENDIRRTYDINAISHFWTIKEFLPVMMSQNAGHIVTIASVASRTGSAYLTDYCGSKWAVFGQIEALRAELSVKKKHGIHLTTVCPSFVDTNLVTGVSDRMGYVNRFGKLLQPKTVAEQVVDGVLRNMFYVYIQKDKGSVALVLEILPMRARYYFGQFMNARFVDKVNE